MPSLIEELEVAAQSNWVQFQKRKLKAEKSGSKSQKKLLAEMERVRRKYIDDPALFNVENKFVEKTGSALRCPRCGAEDRGNRMNGKPWCFKCNKPIDDSSVKGKVLSKRDSFREDLRKLIGES